MAFEDLRSFVVAKYELYRELMVWFEVHWAEESRPKLQVVRYLSTLG